MGVMHWLHLSGILSSLTGVSALQDDHIMLFLVLIECRVYFVHEVIRSPLGEHADSLPPADATHGACIPSDAKGCPHQFHMPGEAAGALREAFACNWLRTMEALPCMHGTLHVHC